MSSRAKNTRAKMSFCGKRTRVDASHSDPDGESNARKVTIADVPSSSRSQGNFTSNGTVRTRHEDDDGNSDDNPESSRVSDWNDKNVFDDGDNDPESSRVSDWNDKIVFDDGNGDDDLESSQVSDWNGKIVFNEKEKVQIIDKDGKSKLRGGIILSSHVWSIPPGERFVVPFNSFYQPIRKGGHILVWFLGDIVKNGDLCPLGEKNWHYVDKVYKANIIKLVRQKFVLPSNEVIDKNLLRRAGKAWRAHRCILKKKYKTVGKTKENLICEMPCYVLKDQWIKLVNYWFSNECEQFSNQGKEARALQDHFHTTGNKSFAMKRDDLEQETGKKLGQLEFFMAAYQRKDGGYNENAASKDFVESAQVLIAQRTSDPSSAQNVEDEVFNELMYGSQDDEYNYRRVVGYGMGVNYNQVFGVEAEIRKKGYVLGDNSGYNSNEEVVKLRSEVANLKTQLNTQSEQIKEMKGMHQQMLDQMQSQFQHLTSILLARLKGNEFGVHTTSPEFERMETSNANTQ